MLRSVCSVIGRLWSGNGDAKGRGGRHASCVLVRWVNRFPQCWDCISIHFRRKKQEIGDVDYCSLASEQM